jgi:DNA helicase HerA-like ATPase
MGTPIVIAKKTTDIHQDIVLHSEFANRHGLIAGATGTGKTVTLKVMAENFSRIGVPVFLQMPKVTSRVLPKREVIIQNLMNGLNHLV